MAITINGSGTITGASTLATTIASPTLTTPNIDSAQISTVSGTAPLYMARAWVNFNGTGTVAIRASGNVSSITDNGTGDYTINFTTAMPNANYSACGNGLNFGNGIVFQITSTATGNVRVQLTNAAIAAYDSSIVTAAIFSS